MWQVAEADIGGPRTPLLPHALSEPLRIDFTQFVASTITREGRERGELSFIKPLMRRALIQNYGVRYQEKMRLGEDFEIYARLLGLGGRLVVVPNRGYVSVVRNNSLSAVHSTRDLQELRDCHDILLKELPLSAGQQSILKRHRNSIDGRLQWRRMIDAVKERDLGRALSCFGSSRHATLYVLRHLIQQVYLRARYGNAGARAISNKH